MDDSIKLSTNFRDQNCSRGIFVFPTTFHDEVIESRVTMNCLKLIKKL